MLHVHYSHCVWEGTLKMGKGVNKNVGAVRRTVASKFSTGFAQASPRGSKSYRAGVCLNPFTTTTPSAASRSTSGIHGDDMLTSYLHTLLVVYK